MYSVLGIDDSTTYFIRHLEVRDSGRMGWNEVETLDLVGLFIFALLSPGFWVPWELEEALLGRLRKDDEGVGVRWRGCGEWMIYRTSTVVDRFGWIEGFG